MSDGATENSSTELITPAERRRVWFAAALFLAFCSAVTGVAMRQMAVNKFDAAKRHVDWFKQTEADAKPTNPKLTEVESGIYVDRISEVSIKDVHWEVDFYVWFRWKGDEIKIGDDFNEEFRIVNGWADEAQLDKRTTVDGVNYVRFRVLAKISKFFDLKRFPLDDHLLTLNIEPRVAVRQQMLLVPDEEHSGLSSRVRITSFKITNRELTERAHAYQTTLGDPELSQSSKAVFSQLRYGLSVERDDWGYFFKMFQGLFASIAVALVVMFIKPTDVDPRFGLGVGAFFAAIANGYITSGLIPDTGVTTMADMINGAAMLMIFLTIVQSTVSLYLYDIRGREALARYFDWISFWVFLMGAIAFNAAMPFLAKS